MGRKILKFVLWLVFTTTLLGMSYAAYLEGNTRGALLMLGGALVYSIAMLFMPSAKAKPAPTSAATHAAMPTVPPAPRHNAQMAEMTNAVAQLEKLMAAHEGLLTDDARSQFEALQNRIEALKHRVERLQSDEYTNLVEAVEAAAESTDVLMDDFKSAVATGWTDNATDTEFDVIGLMKATLKDVEELEVKVTDADQTLSSNDTAAAEGLEARLDTIEKMVESIRERKEEIVSWIEAAEEKREELAEQLEELDGEESDESSADLVKRLKKALKEVDNLHGRATKKVAVLSTAA